VPCNLSFRFISTWAETKKIDTLKSAFSVSSMTLMNKANFFLFPCFRSVFSMHLDTMLHDYVSSVFLDFSSLFSSYLYPALEYRAIAAINSTRRDFISTLREVKRSFTKLDTDFSPLLIICLRDNCGYKLMGELINNEYIK
jgi:hypothetical protein